ncbi:plastocyanin/azurin family copper-binding protein [Rudaea sp.]|uniref:plastocyanin/azurin family copper-binding protein n=1 Tax=Rudaea sp. TaxID=2136325 RepID=UPI002ED1182F
MSATASDHQVSVGGSNDAFSPSTLTINAGDTVTFTEVSGSHNVVSDTPGLFRCANGCDGDGKGGNGNVAGNNWSVTISFPTAGTFGYYCEAHGAPGVGMYGTVRVNAVAFGITPGITGLWYNKSQSGQGFDVQVLGNGTIVAIWYVFDNAGHTLWLFGQGSYSGGTATLDVYTSTGGLFPPAFDPATVARNKYKWGTFTLSFSDCNTGTASWVPLVPGYTSGSMSIVRLSGVGGLACP